MKIYRFLEIALVLGLVALAGAKDFAPVDTAAPVIPSIKEVQKSEIGIARFFGSLAIFFTTEQPATTFLFATVTRSDSAHKSIEQPYWSVSQDTVMATLFIPDCSIQVAERVQAYIASHWQDRSVAVYETTRGLVDITALVAGAK